MTTVFSVSDDVLHPVMDSLNFLNEAMRRFPTAISFAPGAPNRETLPNLAGFEESVSQFVEHVQMTKGLSTADTTFLLQEYGPTQGIINDLISAALANDDGESCDPKDLVVTVGAQEAMVLVLLALVPRGRATVAFAEPCFVGFQGAVQALGIDSAPIAQSVNGIDLISLEQSCIDRSKQGKPITMLYLSSDYSNPAGLYLSLTDRLEVLKLAEKYDFLVVDDNVYGFTNPVKLPTLRQLDKAGRLVSIGTFAKLLFPGTRVGFVLAPQAVSQPPYRLAAVLKNIKSMTTVNTPPLNQAYVGGQIIQHGVSLNRLGVTKAPIYRRNLEALLDALNSHRGRLAAIGVSWNEPAGGFFVVLDMPFGASAEDVGVSASEHEVIWTPMSSFYSRGGGESQIRLSCSYLEEAQIRQGVERLIGYLETRARNQNA